MKQLVEGFRAAHQVGRVLVCSGYTPEEVSLPLELVDDFLAKPFSGDVLAQRIWQLLVPAPLAAEQELALRPVHSAKPLPPGEI